MATKKNEAQEVVAEVIEPSNALEVSYSPAVISDNLATVDAWVDSQIAQYGGITIDPEDYEQVKLAKSIMAELNHLKEPIEAERKRIENAYEKPLKDFKAKVKKITEKIDNCREAIKVQVDEANNAYEAMRFAVLWDTYETFDPTLASVVPLERFLEHKWVTRSCNDKKAENELFAAVQKIRKELETLKSYELAFPQETEAFYYRELDLSKALIWDSERAKEQQRIDEANAEVAAIQAAQVEAIEEPQEPQRMEQLTSDGFQMAEQPSEYVLQFTATKSQLGQIKQFLDSIGIESSCKRIR